MHPSDRRPSINDRPIEQKEANLLHKEVLDVIEIAEKCDKPDLLNNTKGTAIRFQSPNLFNNMLDFRVFRPFTENTCAYHEGTGWTLIVSQPLYDLLKEAESHYLMTPKKFTQGLYTLLSELRWDVKNTDDLWYALKTVDRTIKDHLEEIEERKYKEMKNANQG